MILVACSIPLNQGLASEYKPGTIVVFTDPVFNFGGIAFQVDLFHWACMLLGQSYQMIGTHTEVILEEDGTCISATQGSGVRLSNIEDVLPRHTAAIFIEVDLTTGQQEALRVASKKYLGLPYGHNTYNGAGADFLASFFLQFCSDDIRLMTVLLHDVDSMVCSEVGACIYRDIGMSITIRTDEEAVNPFLPPGDNALNACNITTPLDILRAVEKYPYMRIKE